MALVSFFVAALLVQGTFALKENFLDTAQPQSLLEDQILSSFVNRTNDTLFLAQFGVNVPRNKSAHDPFEEQLLAATNEHRGRVCLGNVNECMQKDIRYQPALQHFSKFLFQAVPPFDLSSVSGVSQRCRKESLQYIQDLKEFKIWALKMYDANAKIPSGFLSGNINQLGDFDLCLSVKSEQNIKGQYCLAAIQVEIPDNPYLSAIHSLIHSNYAFKSKLEDPGHRVPRFSTVNWALCMPNSCSAKDVELGLREGLGKIFNGTNLELRYEVDPNMCHHVDSNPTPWSTFLVGGFFALVLLTALLGGVYDYLGGTNNQVLLAFSLKRTITSLISFERSADDIEAVHGIRFLNAIALLFSHKSMALFFIPFINRTQMSEIVGQPWTVLGRAASLYTDPFIMMSGTLTAYTFVKKLQQSGKLNIRQEYISRLVRIIPTFGALILFCTFILPWLNMGPQWNLVVTHHAENCKKYWWRNMLFIHNYFGFEDMCMTHTHHVGIDMQLFFTSPFLVLAIWKWQKKGVVALVTLATISTIARFHVTMTKHLSNYIHYGASIQQLFKTADNMYILPFHRLTVYIMGILLGFALHKYKHVTMSLTTFIVGYILAFISLGIAFLGPAFMGNINYTYNPKHAAWYAAAAPILWCTLFGWVIFTSCIGRKGIFGWAASWPIFLVSTRLSYALYLTQFPIFFYNVGITKGPDEYGFFTKNFNLSEIATIIFFSVMMTVLFDMPFQYIRNRIRRKSVVKLEIQKNGKIEKKVQ